MAAPVDQKVNATYFSSTPVTCCDQIEANLHLYIHQFSGSPDQNQQVVVNRDTQGTYPLGPVVINDWEVREGSDPASKLVARAEGIHLLASTIASDRWYTSFNLVFEDDSSFKGSTLEVRGAWVTSAPINWAVVSGTGHFTLAQGIVTGTNINTDLPLHRTMEVFIRIFYRPIN